MLLIVGIQPQTPSSPPLSGGEEAVRLLTLLSSPDKRRLGGVAFHITQSARSLHA